jgi:hypothetical protein
MGRSGRDIMPIIGGKLMDIRCPPYTLWIFCECFVFKVMPERLDYQKYRGSFKRCLSNNNKIIFWSFCVKILNILEMCKKRLSICLHKVLFFEGKKKVFFIWIFQHSVKAAKLLLLYCKLQPVEAFGNWGNKCVLVHLGLYDLRLFG